MTQNPYPEYIIDEASNVAGKNQQHIDWGNGYDAGFDDCLNKFEKNLMMVEKLMDQGVSKKQIIDRLIEASRRK